MCSYLIAGKYKISPACTGMHSWDVGETVYMTVILFPIHQFDFNKV